MFIHKTVVLLFWGGSNSESFVQIYSTCYRHSLRNTNKNVSQHPALFRTFFCSHVVVICLWRWPIFYVMQTNTSILSLIRFPSTQQNSHNSNVISPDFIRIFHNLVSSFSTFRSLIFCFCLFSKNNKTNLYLNFLFMFENPTKKKNTISLGICCFSEEARRHLFDIDGFLFARRRRRELLESIKLFSSFSFSLPLNSILCYSMLEQQRTQGKRQYYRQRNKRKLFFFC